jgi:aryl-alcohol dehydrogenase-like predicted oxidoreductase
MEYRTLGKTGLKVSALSFGASSLGGVFKPVDESVAIRSVHTALDLGINYIDLAPFYGLTKAEPVLGKALHSIPRDKYYLATKIGRFGKAEFELRGQHHQRVAGFRGAANQSGPDRVASGSGRNQTRLRVGRHLAPRARFRYRASGNPVQRREPAYSHDVPRVGES